MEIMNRSEFIREVSRHSNIKLEEIQKVIETCEDVLMDCFRENRTVRPFYGITFKPKLLKDGEYLNPKTLDVVEVKNRKTIHMLLSTTFRQKLNDME